MHVIRQRHTDPRNAYVAHDIYIYILYSYRTYNGFYAFQYIQKGYSTYVIVGCYKPDDIHPFFPCGTNPTVLLNAVHVAHGRALDRLRGKIPRVDRVEADH